MHQSQNTKKNWVKKFYLKDPKQEMLKRSFVEPFQGLKLAQKQVDSDPQKQE